MFTGKQLDITCIVPIFFFLTRELLAARVTTAPVNEVFEGQLSVGAGKDSVQEFFS